MINCRKEEIMDENKEFKECNCDEHYHNKTENWIKHRM